MKKEECTDQGKTVGNLYDAEFQVSRYLEYLLYHLLYWFLGFFSIPIFLLLPGGSYLVKNLHFCRGTKNCFWQTLYSTMFLYCNLSYYFHLFFGDKLIPLQSEIILLNL
jgi:hypothetical protein